MLHKCNKTVKWLFSNSYYHILGVAQNSNLIEIKKKYLERIKQSHPDVESGDHNQFLKLKQAFETLSNPMKRKYYDKSIGIENSTWQLQMGQVNPQFQNQEIQNMLEGRVQKKVKIKLMYDNLTMRCREIQHEGQYKKNMCKMMLFPFTAFGVFWCCWTLGQHLLINYKGDSQYQQNYSKKGKDLSIFVAQIR